MGTFMMKSYLTHSVIAEDDIAESLIDREVVE